MLTFPWSQGTFFCRPLACKISHPIQLDNTPKRVKLIITSCWKLCEMKAWEIQVIQVFTRVAAIAFHVTQKGDINCVIEFMNLSVLWFASTFVAAVILNADAWIYDQERECNINIKSVGRESWTEEIRAETAAWKMFGDEILQDALTHYTNLLRINETFWCSATVPACAHANRNCLWKFDWLQVNRKLDERGSHDTPQIISGALCLPIAENEAEVGLEEHLNFEERINATLSGMLINPPGSV